MDIVIPNTGETYIANAIRFSFNQSSELRVYQNDVFPAPGSLLTSFVECNFPGYAPIPLAGLWSLPSLNMDGEAIILAPVQTFTRASGSPTNTIYGVYITALGGTQLLFAQRANVPKVMGTTGDTFSYLPSFMFRSVA